MPSILHPSSVVNNSTLSSFAPTQANYHFPADNSLAIGGFRGSDRPNMNSHNPDPAFSYHAKPMNMQMPLSTSMVFNQVQGAHSMYSQPQMNAYNPNMNDHHAAQIVPNSGSVVLPNGAIVPISVLDSLHQNSRMNAPNPNPRSTIPGYPSNMHPGLNTKLPITHPNFLPPNLQGGGNAVYMKNNDANPFEEKEFLEAIRHEAELYAEFYQFFQC